MQFPTDRITTDELTSPLLTERKIQLFVLRLDKIHPVVSGNKLFKLHYFLKEAIKSRHHNVVTFGGAYSNHLVATAFACRELALNSVGIVRGEEPAMLSPTLRQCRELNMKLKFVSREAYRHLSQQPGRDENATQIPEGGYSPVGAQGAALIIDLLQPLKATHIATATGTATTLAGLLLRAGILQTVIGVPVLKGMTDIAQRLQLLTGNRRYNNLVILDDYHFGGYGKKDTRLISFMNDLYHTQNLPTDFVYTAKMMYAVFDKVKDGFFPEGSRIVAIHTGGLQGNKSLPEGTLIF